MAEDGAASLGRSFGDNFDRHISLRIEMLKFPSAQSALAIAIRLADGTFVTNPDPSAVLEPTNVLIAIGTPESLALLDKVVLDR